MAGVDGGQLRDVTRWAASFVARLFTGATPAQLVAEEDDGFTGGGSCNSLYRSVSTVEGDVELDDGDTGRRRPEFRAADDAFGYESDQEQLLAADDGEDPCRARRVVVCERSLGAHTVSRACELLRRRPATAGDASRSGDDAAMEAQSEPLMLRRETGERRGVAETIDHPFGFGRRESPSTSSLPLLSL